MTNMNLNEFLRARYTSRLQDLLQDFIDDVGQGPKDLGIIAVTTLSVALDFCEQCPKLVGPIAAKESFPKFLDDIETMIANRFKTIRGQMIETLQIEAKHETKH